MFEGQQGGVTHIAFSPDGTKLYSGGRKVCCVVKTDLSNCNSNIFRQFSLFPAEYFLLYING